MNGPTLIVALAFGYAAGVVTTFWLNVRPWKAAATKWELLATGRPAPHD